MTTKSNHISVCICTFKRGELLSRLLQKLDSQRTDDLFSHSVVVADNDANRSAEGVVKAFSATSRIRVTYCCESQQNIAKARNKALENASGNLIAFIDDDELPVESWLLDLFATLKSSGADGVLGPVKPSFEHDVPVWIRRGGFFDRPDYATGYKLGYTECRTGNVLFQRKIIGGEDKPFREHFATAGEDVDFFRRMIQNGCKFVWCHEAVAYEVIPPARCNRSFLLKRALLRGSNFPKHPDGRVLNFLKSMIAVPLYVMALPILALLGHHLFVKYLVKLCDHGSRLLAFAGWTVMKERET